MREGEEMDRQKGSRKNRGSKRPVNENYFPTGLQHQFELWVLHFNEEEIIRLFINMGLKM